MSLTHDYFPRDPRKREGSVTYFSKCIFTSQLPSEEVNVKHVFLLPNFPIL